MADRRPQSTSGTARLRPTRQFAPERREAIAALINEGGRVSVVQLAKHFDVSAVTIRKDLSALEAERRTLRTHGGAIQAPTSRVELAFDLRERLMRAEKAAIGAVAAGMVQDGESIALDASTTALQVTRHLRGHRELTVVTNGLRIAMALAGTTGVTVLVVGGTVRSEALSLVGTWSEPIFERVNISKAFVGAAGLTVQAGLCDVTEEEAQMKRAMVKAAASVIALVDSSKWGRVAAATFCPLEKVALLISDSKAPEKLAAEVTDLGVKVRLVEPSRVDTASSVTSSGLLTREVAGSV